MNLFQGEAHFDIEKGDAFELIKRLEPNSVNLAITSPPYNIGKVYEKRTTLQSYLSPFSDFAKALYRATRFGPAGE